MDADRIKHLRFLAETAFMSPAARDAFVELLNAHEPILNGSAISAARKEAAECRKRAGDAEDAQAQLEERMVILRGQLRLANSVMLKTERELIEARAQLALAMQWGAEACTERDELQLEWDRELDNLERRQEQIERAHAHTDCEHEDWTNAHDLGECLARSVAELSAQRNDLRAQLAAVVAAGRGVLFDSECVATVLRQFNGLNLYVALRTVLADTAQAAREHDERVRAAALAESGAERDSLRAQLDSLLAKVTWMLTAPDFDRAAVERRVGLMPMTELHAIADAYIERVRAEERERAEKRVRELERLIADRLDQSFATGTTALAERCKPAVLALRGVVERARCRGERAHECETCRPNREAIETLERAFGVTP